MNINAQRIRLITILLICLVWMAALSHGAERKGAHKTVVKAKMKSVTRPPLPAPPGATPVKRAEVQTKGASIKRPVKSVVAVPAPWQLRISWVWLDDAGNILPKPGRETVVVIEEQLMSDVGKWKPIGYVTNGNSFVTQGVSQPRKFRAGLLP